MEQKVVNNIFKNLSKDHPKPQTELLYVNQFTFLVSIVLSAQATDVSVNKATKNLFKFVKTPKDMIELGEEKLKKHIKSIGLYNSKSKNIIGLSKILIKKYCGKIPKKFNELTSLPGVGNKTASVYHNVALGLPRIAVDTHVYRVANRTGIVRAKTSDLTQKHLEKIVSKKWLMTAHHLLILHGRYVCKSRSPLCKKCSIFNFCEYKGKVY
jgi:endonuclease-3